MTTTSALKLKVKRRIHVMTSTFGMDYLRQTVPPRQESNSLQRKVSSHLYSSKLPRQYNSVNNSSRSGESLAICSSSRTQATLRRENNTFQKERSPFARR